MGKKFSMNKMRLQMLLDLPFKVTGNSNRVVWSLEDLSKDFNRIADYITKRVGPWDETRLETLLHRLSPGGYAQIITQNLATIAEQLERLREKGPDGDVRRTIVNIRYPDGSEFGYDLNSVDYYEFRPGTSDEAQDAELTVSVAGMFSDLKGAPAEKMHTALRHQKDRVIINLKEPGDDV